MSQADVRAHIERYALSPRHRVVAIAALESAPYDERDGVQWLVLANNIVKALDELEAGYTAQQVERSRRRGVELADSVRSGMYRPGGPTARRSLNNDHLAGPESTPRKGQS
jgi:hypothetical protein